MPEPSAHPLLSDEAFLPEAGCSDTVLTVAGRKGGREGGREGRRERGREGGGKEKGKEGRREEGARGGGREGRREGGRGERLPCERIGHVCVQSHKYMPAVHTVHTHTVSNVTMLQK